MTSRTFDRPLEIRHPQDARKLYEIYYSQEILKENKCKAIREYVERTQTDKDTNK